MMDGLSKFEKALDKPRNKWSKADWRMVANELAGVGATKGRPKLTEAQKKNRDFHIQAAEFWRDQAIEMESVQDGDIDKLVELRNTPLVDGDVSMAITRKVKLDQFTATKMVIIETINRLDDTPDLSEKDKKQISKVRANKDKATATLVREIQVAKKNRREK
jgi:hypothetical protein